MLVVNLTVGVGSCLTVQDASQGKIGFGAVLGMRVSDWMSRLI